MAFLFTNFNHRDMTYIDLINNFWRLNKEHSFTANETTVYFALLDTCNELRWKNPFNQSNRNLANKCNVTEPTFIRARNFLQQKGLISFKSEAGRRKNTEYKIKYLKNFSISDSISDSICSSVSDSIYDSISNENSLHNNRLKNNTRERQEEDIKEKLLKEKFPFDDFWDLYDKKTGDKTKLSKKWDKISEQEREKIFEYVPKYKLSQPDKQYRKNPETFLNNKSWNDELIGVQNYSPVVSNDDVRARYIAEMKLMMGKS